MSVVEGLKEVNLCEKPYMKGAHMGPLANMIISRNLYKKIHEIVVQRVQNGMEIRVPPFKNYQVRERRLDANQTRYATVHELLK